MLSHVYPLKETGFWLAVYALLQDALGLLLFGFAGLMTLEGLIPGLVSGHLSLAKLLFAITAILFLFILLGQKYFQQLSVAESRPPKRWMILALLLWSCLLTVNALLTFPLSATAVILILTGIIVFLLHRLFFLDPL